MGEIIDAWDYLGKPKDYQTDYIVVSVIYKLTKEGFAAYISAQQFWRGYRHELLRERGWLVPEDFNRLAYDDEDPARLEKSP